VLTYSNEEIFWDCVSMNASESFPDGIPAFYDTGMKQLNIRLLKEVFFGNAQRINVQRFHASWLNLVADYSGRQLTRETDRLAAVLGVANKAANFLQDEFVLGLWKSRLWRELLWFVRMPGRRDTMQRAFVAPSWTWASVTGAVSFELLGRDGENLEQLVQILEVDTEIDHTLPVLKGKLVVRGPVITVSQEAMKDGNTSLNMHMREDIEGTATDSILCLVVAFSNRHVYALALAQVDATYKRIGMVTWRDQIGPDSDEPSDGLFQWRSKGNRRVIVLV
jgi:hypothetical protein